MKCEICHKAEASAVLRRKGKDGEVRELFVCNACAKENSGKRKAKEGKPSAKDNGDEPPQFVTDLLEATLGFVKGIAETEKFREKEKPKDCPACGRSIEEMKDTHRIGCPKCWETFGEEIRTFLLEGQYGMKHVGGSPVFGGHADPRTEIRRKINAAVKRQDFETAAELRRRLDEIEAAAEEQREGNGE